MMNPHWDWKIPCWIAESSTGMLEIIMFIEDELGVTVEDEEMIPENLDSVNRISNFVGRKK